MYVCVFKETQCQWGAYVVRHGTTLHEQTSITQYSSRGQLCSIWSTSRIWQNPALSRNSWEPGKRFLSFYYYAMNAYYSAVTAGGIMTTLAVFMSLRLVSRHLKSWSHPKQQTLIIAIIAMVPLFAIDSFVGLLEVHATVSATHHATVSAFTRLYTGLLVFPLLLSTGNLCPISGLRQRMLRSIRHIGIS